MGIDAQQLHDHIIKPTLEYMGGNYNSENARFLLLCTAAIESNCGQYLKQINGPALGVWQMELDTLFDIQDNCDAINYTDAPLLKKLDSLDIFGTLHECLGESLVISPSYACAMARLKYSMDVEPLPERDNFRTVYDYYKRIYNTPAGASTYEKFKQACIDNKIFEVKL